MIAASASTVEWFAKQVATATLDGSSGATGGAVGGAGAMGAPKKIPHPLQAQTSFVEFKAPTEQVTRQKSSAAAATPPLSRIGSLARMGSATNPSMLRQGSLIDRTSDLSTHWRVGHFLFPKRRCVVCHVKIVKWKGHEGIKCRSCKLSIHNNCCEALQLQTLLITCCPRCGAYDSKNPESVIDSIILKHVLIANDKLGGWAPGEAESQQAACFDVLRANCRRDVELLWEFFDENGDGVFDISDAEALLRCYLNRSLQQASHAMYFCIRDFIALRGIHKALRNRGDEKQDALRRAGIKRGVACISAALQNVPYLAAAMLKGMDMNGQDGVERFEFVEYFFGAMPKLCDGHSLIPRTYPK